MFAYVVSFRLSSFIIATLTVDAYSCLTAMSTVILTWKEKALD